MHGLIRFVQSLELPGGVYTHFVHSQATHTRERDCRSRAQRMHILSSPPEIDPSGMGHPAFSRYVSGLSFSDYGVFTNLRLVSASSSLWARSDFGLKGLIQKKHFNPPPTPTHLPMPFPIIPPPSPYPYSAATYLDRWPS